MQQIDLQAFPREGRGKGPARQLRRSGRFPAVVYGGDKPAQAIALDTTCFELLLHHGFTSSSLVNLAVEGESEPQLVILRDLDRDPVSRRLNHLDFYRVRLDQLVEFEVPVHGHGTSPGVKSGGILEHSTRTVTVRCRPADVPASLDVSIEELDFGHTIHLSDITLPEGVEAVSDGHVVLFSVVAARAAVSAAAEGEEVVEGEEAPIVEGEEPTEPEVIGKGKRDDEKEG